VPATALLTVKLQKRPRPATRILPPS
jgi:hypothetical protein